MAKNSAERLFECDTCGEDLPLDASHFDRKHDTPTGFRTTCKVCRAENRRNNGLQAKSPGLNKTEKELDEQLEKLEGDSVQLLKAFTPGASSRVPHTAEMWESVARIFGGADGLARHIYSNYLAAGVGSVKRIGILSQAIKLGMEVTRSGDATKPIDMMTDDELVQALDGILEEQILNRPDLLLRKIAERNPEAMRDFAREAASASGKQVPVEARLVSSEVEVAEVFDVDVESL